MPEQIIAPRKQNRSETHRPDDLAASVVLHPSASHAGRGKGVLGRWWRVFWRIIMRASDSMVSMTAAAIAFYFFFSIFPAIAVFVSVYGLMAGPATVETQAHAIDRLLPPEAGKLVTDALNVFASKGSLALNAALIISFLATLWSARAGIWAMMTGLNIVFERPEQRSYLVQQLTALALTLAAIVAGIALFSATSIAPVVLQILPAKEETAPLVLWLRWPFLAALVALGFATIYRFAPCRPRARWRVSPGAIVATGLWMVGSSLFSLYISSFRSYDAIYGSLAAVAVLMLWLWLTAFALLTGAVIDAERERPSS
jgi:membrane protein